MASLWSYLEKYSTFYLMCGISGSGKTTFSKEFAADGNLLYLCPDDFYAVFSGTGTAEGHKNEFDVWSAFFRAIHNAEREGSSCIIDTNAPTFVDREQFLNWFPGFNEYHLIYIKADEDLCVQNNKKRDRVIPDNEIRRMIRKFEEPDPEKESRWNSITVFENKNNNGFELVSSVDLQRDV